MGKGISIESRPKDFIKSIWSFNVSFFFVIQISFYLSTKLSNIYFGFVSLTNSVILNIV